MNINIIIIIYYYWHSIIVLLLLLFIRCLSKDKTVYLWNIYVFECIFNVENYQLTVKLSGTSINTLTMDKVLLVDSEKFIIINYSINHEHFCFNFLNN